MYDAEGKLVYMWGQPRAGSRVAITESAWVWLTAGACVGHAGPIAIPSPNDMTLIGGQVRPGTYYLQTVYMDAFIGLCQRNGSSTVYKPSDGDKLMEGFDDRELFRSNVVEIELTD